MKNNKLIYLLILVLLIWCIALSVMFSNDNKSINSDQIINEYYVSGYSTDLTKIIDENKSSIVSIYASGNVSTGFIYKQDNEDVYILTSYHGVSDANTYYVYFANGYSVNANIVGKDIYTDLAVLHVTIPYETNPLKLGDCKLLKSGEFIISIGTPYSLEYNSSCELGMISNALRTIDNSINVDSEKHVYYLNVIQMSSNLKPGYSGSPVLNMNGEVVGMTTMSLDDNINFAITINEIKTIADKIIVGEEVKNIQLGIKGDYVSSMPMFERTNLNLSVETINGLYVEKTLDNSISHVCGIKTGDVVLKINDIEINNLDDILQVTYSEYNEVNFEVLRNNEVIELKATIND